MKYHPIEVDLRSPARNKGLIAGLIKGNQLLISPDHKAFYISGGVYVRSRLTSHDRKLHLSKDKLIQCDVGKKTSQDSI